MTRTDPQAPPRPRRSRRLLWQLPLALGAAFLTAAATDEQPLWVQLKAHEVALVSRWNRTSPALLESPGWHFLWPFGEHLERFDRSSRLLRLTGSSWTSDANQPQLSVRSADGSEFWFEDLAIRFELDPELLRQHPRADDPELDQTWVAATARSILGEEFGRLSVQESVDPARLEAAKQASLLRLKAATEAQALVVTEILTDKPQFDRQYEKAVGDRKLLEQEALNLTQQLEAARAGAGEARAAAEREGERALAKQQSDLVRERLMVETELLRATAEIENQALAREGDGRAREAELLAQAESLNASRAAKRSSLEAELAALREHGDIYVRRQLVAALFKVPLRLAPRPAEVER
jgi:hypothetical protein